MKHFYIFTLIINLNGFAQKYQPDRVIYNNKEFDYRFHHLEQYFNYYPDKRIVINKDSTIINRGYIALYEIFENEIYLRDIKVQKKENSEYISVREKFNPSKEERIPLRWVNGVSQIGLGQDDFKRDSLRPINTNNIIFEIQRGKIQRKLELGKEEMRIFKNFQFQKYQNTHEYLLLTYRLRQTELNDDQIKIHIFNNVFYYSKKIFLQK